MWPHKQRRIKNPHALWPLAEISCDSNGLTSLATLFGQLYFYAGVRPDGTLVDPPSDKRARSKSVRP